MTINRTTFATAWRKLEGRFGKQPPGAAADYLGYLSEILTEQEFQCAWRAVWSSREFFPRPDDFLMVRQGQDWEKLQRAVVLARRKEDWVPVFDSMTPAGQKGIQALGGIFVVSDQMQKAPAFLRKDFRAEYETAVQTIAIENALPPGDTETALPEVTPESRRIVGEVLAGARQLDQGEKK